jgi:hypothetical protein
MPCGKDLTHTNNGNAQIATAHTVRELVPEKSGCFSERMARYGMLRAEMAIVPEKSLEISGTMILSQTLCADFSLFDENVVFLIMQFESLV